MVSRWSVEPQTVASPDDEIDLRELAAALQRRWRWSAGGLALGLTLGGLAGLRQQPSQEMQLVVNLARGPQVPGAVIEGNQGSISLKPAQDQSEVSLLLQQLVSKTANATDWSVAPLKQGKETSAALVAISADTDPDDAPSTLVSLERIAQEFRQLSSEQLRGTANLSAAQPGWLQVILGKPTPPKRSLSLALGALAGLVLGCGGSLIADRRSGRVFSLLRLRQLLPYPLWGRLPVGFPEGAASGVALDQLGAFLKPELRWQVMSIANPHPQLVAVVEALHQRHPNLDVAPGPVLLREAFNPGAGSKTVGCLLLVESGFNSEAALAQAYGLLEQLPMVAEVALVLSGGTPPPELLHTSSAN